MWWLSDVCVPGQRSGLSIPSSTLHGGHLVSYWTRERRSRGRFSLISKMWVSLQIGNSIENPYIPYGRKSHLHPYCDVFVLKWVRMSGVATDIERRSRNSYTAPWNGAVSHGTPIGGIWDFADHTRGNKFKQKASTIFLCFTRVYRHAQTAVHMHLMNHGYFDCRKNPNTSNLIPHAGIKIPHAGIKMV